MENASNYKNNKLTNRKQLKIISVIETCTEVIFVKFLFVIKSEVMERDLN